MVLGHIWADGKEVSMVESDVAKVAEDEVIATDETPVLKKKAVKKTDV
jgi:hypothetical protein